MEGLNKSDASNCQFVSDAYVGKSIFVTGGTGFVGKVLIEKILYDCPKVSKVYVLLRKHPKYSIEERIRNMVAKPLFNRLRAGRPQDLDKLVPVAGDVVLPKLGLNPEDEETLMNSVSYVFHIAATTKFTETLQNALKINLIGTKNVLDLCQRIIKIEAFIHVSTAYSNPYLETIKETLYPPISSLEEAELLAERTFISEEETKKIVGCSYNTYTFTKGLAENYVELHHGNVPTAIVRPSAVISSKAEPLVGWVDTWSGTNHMIVSFAEGYNRTMLTNSKYYIDLIPVDYVVNIAVVVAAKLKRTNKIEVYNICSTSKNPITIGEFIKQSTDICIKHKWNKVPFPKAVLTESKWIVRGISLFQKLCALLVDSLLYIVGKQPRYAKHQSLLVKTQTATEIFTTRTWEICADNTCALFESLSETDRKCFDFNPRNIVWPELLFNFMKGVQKYLYKKDID